MQFGGSELVETCDDDGKTVMEYHDDKFNYSKYKDLIKEEDCFHNLCSEEKWDEAREYLNGDTPFILKKEAIY